MGGGNISLTSFWGEMSRHQPGPLRYLPPPFHSGWGDPAGRGAPQHRDPRGGAPRGKDEPSSLGFDDENYPAPQPEGSTFSRLESETGATTSPGTGPSQSIGTSSQPQVATKPAGSQVLSLPDHFTPPAATGHRRESSPSSSCSDTVKGDYEASIRLKPGYGSSGTGKTEEQRFFLQEASLLDRPKDDPTAQEIQGVCWTDQNDVSNGFLLSSLTHLNGHRRFFLKNRFSLNHVDFLSLHLSPKMTERD
ncbi:unnamed protein product [Caretta caretta]|nr:homeobox protein Hox-B9 isoform X3 [Caretta caretta]